jgi:hypothetical protein
VLGLSREKRRDWMAVDTTEGQLEQLKRAWGYRLVNRIRVLFL